MLTIHKYELDAPNNVVQMPCGAQVLTVQMQRRTPCLWAKVDPAQPTETRRFAIYGTGHEVPDDPRMLYLGTVQMEGGALVFHVFELPVEAPTA